MLNRMSVHPWHYIHVADIVIQVTVYQMPIPMRRRGKIGFIVVPKSFLS